MEWYTQYIYVQSKSNRAEHKVPLATSEGSLDVQSWNELNVMVIHGLCIPHRHIVFLSLDILCNLWVHIIT